MENEKEKIIKEIDRYKASLTKIKKVTPLVIVVVVMFTVVIPVHKIKSTAWQIVGITAVIMYAGSFVLAYYQGLKKIKKLEKQLGELK